MKYASENQKPRFPVSKPPMSPPLDDFRENPKNYSGDGRGSMYTSGKGMGSVEKPSVPATVGILERYREMLRERDEDLMGASNEEDQLPPPLTADEAFRIYEALLADLAMNSKPVITDLTIIAGEQREHGEGIANAICCRIVEVPVDKKLPSLYLLDSIVKNIGCEYIHYFSSRLPEVFLATLRQVDPSQYSALRHLFGTWSKVFPDSVLMKIDTQLQLMSESPQLRHGIHVNPKYVEARRRSESFVGENDKQCARVASSLYGDEDYAIDNTDNLKDEERTMATNGRAGRSVQSLMTSRLISSSDPRHARPIVDELSAHNSSRWPMERDRIEADYKQDKATDRDAESWRKYSSDRIYPKVDTSSAYSEFNNPRALIDAYGNDRGKENKSSWQDTTKALIDVYGNDSKTDRQPHWPDNKYLNIGQLKENLVTDKVSARSWKNTEEEEYDWEDMTPTLADGGRSNKIFQSFIPSQGGSMRARHEPELFGINNSESEFRRSNWSSSVPAPKLTRGTTSFVSDHQNQRSQISSSLNPQEVRTLPHHGVSSTQTLFNGSSRGNIQLPHLAGNKISSIGEEAHHQLGYSSESDSQLHTLRIVAQRGSSSDFDKLSVDGSNVAPLGAWSSRSGHSSLPPPAVSVIPRQIGQYNSVNSDDSAVNQRSNESSFLPDQRFTTSSNHMRASQLQLPNQLSGYFSNKQPIQMQVTPLPPRCSQEGHVNYGLTRHGQLGARPLHPGNTMVPNVMPGAYFSNHVHNILTAPGQPYNGGPPPLVPRPGPPPILQTSGYPQNLGNPAPGDGALSGLISSLMSQGLISLSNQQDSVGTEFSPDTLKVRHESAIKALYANLPRQCTTCGLRFKDQELHQNHMDWHVKRNRTNKNSKQKASRKWFASASMWLSGSEASGPEAAPGFLSTETVVEMKDEEEMAVPADEDQTSCALCGEPFDDFYSHETDEWMYRGAVYLNVNPGSTAGLDRSQLGPIVHAKCRPHSVANYATTSNQINDEDGCERKRMRIS